MNALTITPEQFIFASENTLKTTSLKIAERFGKDHSNVLKAIDKILMQVSDSFGKVNFNATEYEQENNLGLMSKHRSYDLTRDGFMIVVMSFTGKPAMAIKEWYINAFNAMADKLQKPFGLKSLPPSPHISESEASQFKKSIEALCGGNRKKYSELYRIVYDYYEITDYKNIPAGKLEESAKLIGMKLLPFGKLKIPTEPFTLSFTPEELEDLVVERIKSVAGELVEKPSIPTDTISLSLNGGTGAMNIIFNGANDNAAQDYYVKICQSEVSITKLCNERFKTTEEIIADLVEDGYIVMKKAELLGRLEA
jgi:Rha family phage regulatory protein